MKYMIKKFLLSIIFSLIMPTVSSCSSDDLKHFKKINCNPFQLEECSKSIPCRNSINAEKQKIKIKFNNLIFKLILVSLEIDQEFIRHDNISEEMLCRHENITNQLYKLNNDLSKIERAYYKGILTNNYDIVKILTVFENKLHRLEKSSEQIASKL